MEMEEKKGREGGKDEGRKVTCSDTERERDGEKDEVCPCRQCAASVCVSKREFLCGLFARQGQGNTNTHKQLHPLHHREISHLSDLQLQSTNQWPKHSVWMIGL